MASELSGLFAVLDPLLGNDRCVAEGFAHLGAGYSRPN